VCDGDLRYLTTAAGAHRVWRVAPGGSAPPRLLLTLPYRSLENGGYGSVDFSPDGDRMVFADWIEGLVVADLVSGDVRALGVAGTFPRWSPDGGSIAYAMRAPYGGIGVLRPDGGGRRVLNAEYVNVGFGWSPDSRHLVLSSTGDAGGMRLTRVADGAVFPFTVGVDLVEPSWR
jgi:Tol biopolymer transport system component